MVDRNPVKMNLNKNKNKNVNKKKRKPFPKKQIIQNIRNRNVRKLVKMSRYEAALAVPEYANGIQYPSKADRTLAIHRKIVISLQVNALGNAAGFLYPNLIYDNTVGVNNSPFYFSNTVGLTGTNAVTLPATYVRNNFLFGIPAGTVTATRLVSCCMTARSLTTRNTATGDIHMGLVPCTLDLAQAAITADAISYNVLTNLISVGDTMVTKAAVESMETARCIWLPQGIFNTQFSAINTSLANSNALCTDNGIAFVAIGLAASSFMEFEFHYNFEVTTVAGSVLQGLDTICVDRDLPEDSWRNIYMKKNLVAMSYPTALQDSVLNNILASPK